MPDDFCLESVSKAILFYFQLVSGLKIQPESLTCTEEPGKPQSSIRGNVSLSVNNFVNATRGNADIFGQPILANAHWAQKLLQEDLARMNWWKLLRHVVLS